MHLITYSTHYDKPIVIKRLLAKTMKAALDEKRKWESKDMCFATIEHIHVIGGVTIVDQFK